MALSLPALLLVLCSLGVAQALLRVYDLRAVDLKGDPVTETDCYLKLFYDSQGMHISSVINDNNNPHWDEEFLYLGAEQDKTLRVEAFDEDLIYNDKLGSCEYLLKRGTHSIRCYLEESGVLYFNYTLS